MQMPEGQLHEGLLPVATRSATWGSCRTLAEASDDLRGLDIWTDGLFA